MPQVFKCTLSVDKVYQGGAWVDSATLQPGDVSFDHQPDLPVGSYRWNGEEFVPALNKVPFTPDGPDAWYAIYRLIRRLEKQGMNLPQPTKQFLDYYRLNFRGQDPAVEP